MKIGLDKYEERIEDSLTQNEFVSVADLENTRELFQEAMKNYKELQETKSITLRIKKEDLVKVKAKAKKNGLAYQTLINLIIRQYVKGETEVVL